MRGISSVKTSSLHCDWQIEIFRQKTMNTKPEESAECHQTLSFWVESMQKTNACVHSSIHLACASTSEVRLLSVKKGK